MKIFDVAVSKVSVADYHDVVQLQQGSPRIYVQKEIKSSGPTHHAVTFEHGSPTFLVQGDKANVSAATDLLPEMNDSHAVKQATLHGLADAALTMGTGGVGLVGRVGLKNAALPLLERAGFKTLMTAVEFLGQAGQKAKGSELGLRDWLTIGFPVGWNKKNPLFKETLNLLVSLDHVNGEKLSKGRDKLAQAKGKLQAYQAIEDWMSRNTTAPRRRELSTDGGIPKNGFGEWMRNRRLDFKFSRASDEQSNSLNKYLEAIRTLEKMGLDTGLQDNPHLAKDIRVKDAEWDKARAAIRNIPKSQRAADRVEKVVSDLENLDSGLKLILHWLRN